MRSRQMTAVVSAVAGLTVAGVFAAPALAGSRASGSCECRPAPAVSPTTTATPAPTGGTRKTRGFHLDGKVNAVDTSASTITLGLGDDNTRTNVVSVSPTAAISLDGTDVALGALPTGVRVALDGSDSSGTPTATTVSGRSTWDLRLDGSLSAVDPAAGTITVKRPDNSSRTVKVGAGVPLSLDGTSVALSALPLSALVKVSGTDSPAGATATRVEARLSLKDRLPKPKAGDKGDKGRGDKGRGDKGRGDKGKDGGKPCDKPTAQPSTPAPTPSESVEPGSEHS
jgi:hypothetical protein